jgi:NAD(P)-dependent dehydrogenase (short-subunit alcohol dehydrogenase family)
MAGFRVGDFGEKSMFQPDLLNGKRILITGGGTGLGLSMGRRFLQLGAELVICGRRQEVLAEAAKSLAGETGGKVETHSCDIRDSDAVDKMMDAIWANGPLDNLVNNAAGNFIARSEELSPRAIDAVLGIVLHGSAYCTTGCGRRWLKEGRKASVLSIITTYAWTGSAYVVPSAMAKGGVLAMTRSLAVEWGGRGVRLNAIAPGPFPTAGAWDRLVPRADLAQVFETKNPLRRVGQHGELANLAAFLLSDMAAYINGEVVTIDGGEWLQGAGQFNFLDRLTEQDWAALKPKKK